MDIAKFVKLISASELFFSRLDSLSDSHEGSITEPSLMLRKLLNNEKNDQMEMKFNLEVRRFIFINCWRMDIDESEAMWNLYCPNNSGVAIQTTYRNLADSIVTEKDIHLGLISYINCKESNFPTENIYYPAMHKRKAFEHEKEVRLVFSEMNNSEMRKSNNPPEGISTKVRLDKLIEKVYVNPYAQNWYFSVIEELLTKYNLKVPCVWSDINANPWF